MVAAHRRGQRVLVDCDQFQEGLSVLECTRWCAPMTQHPVRTYLFSSSEPGVDVLAGALVPLEWGTFVVAPMGGRDHDGEGPRMRLGSGRSRS